ERRHLSARDTAPGWKLVWALGPQLHLRHLVYTVCTERLRHRSKLTRDPQGRELARIHSKRRRRLGGRWLKLQARLSWLRTGRQYVLANRLGASRADGCR